MGEELEHCMDHSGCITRIDTLEKNDFDKEKRLRAVERSAWQAAILVGAITLIGQTVILHYWR